MLRMSWSTFRERWQLFIGAMITVCLGVALVQASLLTLVAASDPPIPAGLPEVEEVALRDGYAGAGALLGMMVALAAFIAVFIVGSTFAFTVAQRRRDLALLRLTGASRRQVRVLLIGEALLLGAVGTATGIVVGLPLMRFEAWLLVRLRFVPPGFAVGWRWWVIAVAAGAGVGIAVLGVLGASRRASRVRPLEALRDTGQAARVMTWSRWLIGVIFLAGGAAMLTSVRAVGGEGAVPLSFFACFVLVIAFSALSPLVVPLVGGLLGGLVRGLGGGPVGQLAHANLRDGIRRSAATAAPIMVLVGLVAGLGGTLDAMAIASRDERTRTLDADLVVAADRPVADQLSAVSGVRTVSEQIPVVLRVDEAEPGDPPAYGPVDGVAVDAAAYLRTHRLNAAAGDLRQLRGRTVAVSPAHAPEQHWRVGGTLHARLGGETMDLRIVALLPTTLSGEAVLLPRDLVQDADGPRQYLVQVADGADARAVAERVAAAGLGDVSTAAEWIRHGVDEQQRTNLNVMVALLGLAMLYTVIAVINAVVIAAADRGTEFATARLAGLSRGQVVRAAVWESLAVVAVGVLLGGLAAGGTLLGLTWAISDLLGLTVVSVPWQLFGGLALGAAAVVGATSTLTAMAATRQPAVALAGARE